MRIEDVEDAWYLAWYERLWMASVTRRDEYKDLLRKYKDLIWGNIACAFPEHLNSEYELIDKNYKRRDDNG
jgi:hypothetical protein